MRAAVITKPGGPGVLQVQEIEDRSPGPDDILVDVKASALNRADLLQRQGGYPAPAGVRSDVPGLEFSGVVVGVGERVTDMAPGERVFGLLGGGGYADRVVTPRSMAMSIPTNLDFVEAASIPEAYFTAYDALFSHCDLQMGESVLIHAVGSGVGTAAVQLAHHAGAYVLGTAGSTEKLAKAADLGLDVPINYHEQDFAEVVREHLGRAGVNVVLDMVGAPYWERNLASLSLWGRMVLVGMMGGDRVETSLGALMPKRLRVHGTTLRHRPLEEKIALTNKFKGHVLPLIADGRMKPVVDRVFPLEKVSEAHEYMESNANFGKVVLSMEGES